jgi:hypothetical protein
MADFRAVRDSIEREILAILHEETRQVSGL